MKISKKGLGILLIGILVLSIFFTIGSMPETYISETEIVEGTFADLGLQAPVWNETHKMFESEENGDMFVGYVISINPESSTLYIHEFTNYTETIISAGQIFYVSDNDKIILEKNLTRGFNDDNTR